ncbi:MAG: class I SAM-dependent methyltransferase [Promethearchaeota archaeon]
MIQELNKIIDYYGRECIQGYYSVLLISLGRRLGIFDYLLKKEKSDGVNGKTQIIIFSPDIIANDLKLDPIFLDAWFHIALELGIFNVSQEKNGYLETAPYIYELFVDTDSSFYLGNLYGWVYKNAVLQNLIFESFKTGRIIERLDGAVCEASSRDGQKLSTIKNIARLRLFSKNFKNYHQKLRNGGQILEIGCGIGINLQIWVEKYKNTNFVAIDPNPTVISIIKELIKINNWQNQVEVVNCNVREYLLRDEDNKFDVILLNEVLHEIRGDDIYRKDFIDEIYKLLKDDGVLVMGEEMVPNTFEVEKVKTLGKGILKWDEVFFGARHYNEKSFKQFIKSTKFKNARIFKDNINCIWALTK